MLGCGNAPWDVVKLIFCSHVYFMLHWFDVVRLVPNDQLAFQYFEGTDNCLYTPPHNKTKCIFQMGIK
jgi:hypothetical protein